MDSKLFMIETLLERSEQCGKTSSELIKLKSIYKTSDLLSILFFHILMVACIFLFLLLGSVALANFIGSLIGGNYYGFILVSGFYVIIGCILLLFKKIIQQQVKRSLVTKILN